MCRVFSFSEYMTVGANTVARFLEVIRFPSTSFWPLSAWSASFLRKVVTTSSKSRLHFGSRSTERWIISFRTSGSGNSRKKKGKGSGVFKQAKKREGRKKPLTLRGQKNVVKGKREQWLWHLTHKALQVAADVVGFKLRVVHLWILGGSVLERCHPSLRSSFPKKPLHINSCIQCCGCTGQRSLSEDSINKTTKAHHAAPNKRQSLPQL